VTIKKIKIVEPAILVQKKTGDSEKAELEDEKIIFRNAQKNLM